MQMLKIFYCSIVLLFHWLHPNDLTHRKFLKKKKKKIFVLFQIWFFSIFKIERKSIVLLFYCSMGHTHMTWDLENFSKRKKKSLCVCVTFCGTFSMFSVTHASQIARLRIFLKKCFEKIWNFFLNFNYFQNENVKIILLFYCSIVILFHRPHPYILRLRKIFKKKRKKKIFVLFQIWIFLIFKIERKSIVLCSIVPWATPIWLET